LFPSITMFVKFDVAGIPQDVDIHLTRVQGIGGIQAGAPEGYPAGLAGLGQRAVRDLPWISVWPDRNTQALTPEQIAHCQRAWSLVTDGGLAVPLDVTLASADYTLTAYSETDRMVYLGANALPHETAVSANARLSLLACLAHEYAHAERHSLRYERPKVLPDMLLDEAETSIHASFHPVLRRKDREDLVEDARDRLIKWLELAQQRYRGEGEAHEG